MPHTAASTFLRLRPDASIEALTVDATFWQRISSGALGDFHNEFLLAGIGYDKDWTQWEMHPNGDEVVCLLSGSVCFILELPSGAASVELRKPGEYVVVPKGIWHTSKVPEPCRMLFITPGEGTQHRPL